MLQSNISETLDQSHYYLQVNELSTEAQIAELRNILRFHEYRYYTLNDPLVGDTEYDRLYKLLQRTEAAHPEWITPDSPTQRVGPETAAVAVPVFGLGQQFVAAMSVSGPRYRIDASRAAAIVPVLFRHAQLLTQIMGGNATAQEFGGGIKIKINQSD